MAKLDKEELAKLSPQERIQRLKKLEEESKKEIAEAEKLIKKSEEELKRDGMESKLAIPESRQIDISDLFEPPQSQLEQTAQEAHEEEPSQEQLQYMVNQAYEEAAQLAYEQGGEDVLDRVDALGERLEKINYHSLSDQAVNKVVATRSLLYKIKKYHQQDHKW